MKTTILASFFFAFTALNASENYVQCQSNAGIRDLIAGSYYQNASIVGSGTTARSTFYFLEHTLSKNDSFTKCSFDYEDYICTYFHRQKSDTTEIVLLPIEHKESHFLIDLSFDKYAKTSILRWNPSSHSAKEDFTRSITNNILKVLYNNFDHNITCHMLTHESSLLQKNGEVKLTGFGKFTSFFTSVKDKESTHLTYTCINLNETKKFATHFDPESLTVESRYIQGVHQSKMDRYADLALLDNYQIPVNFVYRADQCYNMHDCGRFSMIYLMSAINEKKVDQLSRFDVYQGFKKWIEGANGLLSFQKYYNKKEHAKIHKEQEKKAKILHLKIWEKSTNQMNQLQNYSEQMEQLNKKHQSIIDLHKQETEILFQELISNIEAGLTTPQIEEISNEFKKNNEERKENLDKKLKEIEEEQNLLTAGFKEKTKILTTEQQKYLESIIKENNEALKKSAVREENAPSIQKSWGAVFTTPWRKFIDYLLPRI